MNQISDNEIYLLIKYIKSVLWRVAKCLSYIVKAWCLKVKSLSKILVTPTCFGSHRDPFSEGHHYILAKVCTGSMEPVHVVIIVAA